MCTDRNLRLKQGFMSSTRSRLIWGGIMNSGGNHNETQWYENVI